MLDIYNLTKEKYKKFVCYYKPLIEIRYVSSVSSLYILERL